MNDYSLKNKTDEEVYDKIDQSGVNQARPMVEMMIRLKNSMEETKEAIDKFNTSSSNQTKEVIRLTKWLFYLTIGIGVLAFLQLISVIK